MYDLLKIEIKGLAAGMANIYAKRNPLQAAFIFDRIFLRDTGFDLQPENQLEIIDEDCPPIGDMARRAHNEYIKIPSAYKEDVKRHAIECFKESFNKHGVNFLEYYTPDNTSGSLISFDSVVGRVNAKKEQSSALKTTTQNNRPLTSEEKLANNFFAQNSFRQTIVIKPGHSATSKSTEQNRSSVTTAELLTDNQRLLQREETERRNKEAARAEKEASQKRQAEVAAYQDQFKEEVLTKYLGAGGKVTQIGGNSLGHQGIGDNFTFHYTIGYLKGETVAGEEVTYRNIDEKREVNFGEELTAQRSFGLGGRR